MKNYKIRLAKQKDVDSIVLLNKEGLKSYKWSYDKHYIRMAVSHGNYYVICTECGVIGAIKFFLQKNWLWISTMVISKEHRGKGYAKNLLKFAINKARRHGYNRIRLDTMTTARVGKFYNKMGYTLINEETYYGRKYKLFEKVIS